MRTRIWLLAIIFNLSLMYGQAPPWQWANDANSSGSEYGWDVVSDTVSDHVYVGGKFNGNLSARFGASFSSSYGLYDGFLAKYTDAGVFLWAIKLGGVGDDEVRSVALDPNGNVNVSGVFKGTVDFDPTGTTFNLTSSGGLDGFLAQYSPSGALLWAVKYGGSNDDESWEMYADGNGIFITGYYATAPAIFSSFGSGLTKTTFSNAGGGREMFGAKYNSLGVVQWVVSGGGNKVDGGYSVVADAENVYFIGGYSATANFMDASGVSQASLQAQQNNREQVFIVAYDQAGNFSWQNNITCTNNKDVVGWTIAQDATNLYVSGYMEDNVINFQYPSPSFTQSISGGGGLDIFLAKLSKTGTFTWRAAVTGSGSGEQVGRALAVNSDGDVILSGNFKNTLDYTAAGGPLLTASAYDIFVAAYSTAGTFKWAAKAGNTGDDVLNGTAAGKTRSIYLTGNHSNGATFGAITLNSGSGDNIYVAKSGCDALANNTIASPQTLCEGNTPTILTGSTPIGSGPYTYTWQESNNGSTWVNAAGTFTNQNYSPAALTDSTYYRRVVTVTGACAATLASTSVLISVDQLPSGSVAGNTQTLCASSATLAANAPITGTGLWTVATGTATLTNASSPNTMVSGLSAGANNFVWTISNGVCPASSSTVVVVQDLPPSISMAGTSQAICAKTATLTANPPVNGSGAWSVISGNGSFSSAGNPFAVVSLLGIGPNVFAWTISNGSCAASVSTVTIYRDISPSTANAGSDQSICNSSTTLNANVPFIGNGSWTVVQGGAVVSQTNTASTSAMLGIGQNIFVWSIVNGSCPASHDTVSVTRYDLPTTANAGADQLICSTSSSLNANVPLVGSGVWTSLSGNGFSSMSQPASSVTGLNTGTNTIVWSITNGSCPASHDTVIIRVDAQPSDAQAGDDLRVCQDQVTLSAIPPVTGAGSWRLLGGFAVVNDTTLYNASLSSLASGTTTLLWTTRHGVCPEKTDQLEIVRDLMPDTARAGEDQTTDYPVAMLSGNESHSGTGFWTVVVGSGEIENPAAFKTPVKLSEGENVFRWTIVNGACPSSTDEVMIYERPFSAPNAFSPNQDGINDAFVIPGIDYYDGIKFQVFNRWGGLIYSHSNYRNDWAGLNATGEKIEDDTYYYTLEIPSGKTLTGFIIVKQRQ